MERHNIRRGLINTFLNALHKRKSSETISLLAMIGIETVIQQLQQDDESIVEESDTLSEIEEIKR